MTDVRDAIAAILDNMTLEQFVADGGRVEGAKEEFPISAAS
jgi:DNA-binding IscR family transcriptional regulator